MIHENLYSATYSGVAVYEFIHPKSSVMRRKKDGWVNATHILKVANFPKAKRTRILEKDVQTGVHEKVQGGYGKYQGTWVPLERAIEIAKQFGVLNDLNAVFDYISNGSITPPPAPKHHHASNGAGSRKQKANAKSKSKSITPLSPTKNSNSTITTTSNLTSISNSTSTSNSNSVTPKPKRQKLSTTAQNKKKSLLSLNNLQTKQTNSTQIHSPLQISSTSASRNSLLISNSSNSLDQVNDNFENSRKKRTLKAPKGNIDFSNNSNFSSVSNSQIKPINNRRSINSEDDLDDDIIDDEDDEDRININNKINKNNLPLNGIKNLDSFYRRLHEPSTIEFMSEHDLDKALAESETYGDKNIKNSALFYSVEKNQIQPTATIRTKNNSNSIINNLSNQILDKSYVKALYNYFIEMDSNPNCEMPYFITHQYENFNINQPIDNQGNTSLHWACSMGDVKMCEILINRGCNVSVLNNKGEEPIVRSVIYANCYTRRTFSKLLDLLPDCLLNIDLKGMTLLHHIALATADKNNLPASRYYSEILLRKIAETVQSHNNFKEFIDKQDIEGNTALHIMSFNNSKKCIKILLGYNARVDIRNKRNEQVGDYLTDNFKNDSNYPGLINGFDGTSVSNGSIYDSFNMRPFTPSISNNFNRNNSIPYNKIGNSYMEPFQQPNNYHQNLLLNYSQSSYIPKFYNDEIHSQTTANSHKSTTSIKINQFSVDLNDKLNELSNAFDAEVLQKNDDLKELNSIVVQMDNDINKTTDDTKTLLKRIIGQEGSDIDDVDLSDTIKKVELQINQLSTECDEKGDVLRRLIDRSQAMGLAKIVQTFENDTLSKIDKSESSPSLETNLSGKTMDYLVDLVRLQMIRKKTVNILVNIQARKEANTDIINCYRRLVAKLSNMPIEEVDASLNSIEECLCRDTDCSDIIVENN